MKHEPIERLLTSTSTPALIAQYPSGRVLRANSSADLLYGYRPEEWADLTLYTLFHPEDVKRFREVLNADRRRANSVFSAGIWVHRTKAGTPIEVDLALRRLCTSTEDVWFCQIVHMSLKGMPGPVISLHARKDLLQRVERTLEAERRRLARDTHDGMGQGLTTLRFQLKAIERALLEEMPEGIPPSVAQRLADAHKGLDGLLAELHRAIGDLRPALLDDFGLVAALESLTAEFQRTTQVRVTLKTTGARDIVDEDRRIALFRICQEALTNIGRHSGATQVAVECAITPIAAHLVIADNGKGIRPGQVANAGALGVVGMRERAHMHGGSFTITGLSGTGTTIQVRLPLDDIRTGRSQDVERAGSEGVVH